MRRKALAAIPWIAGLAAALLWHWYLFGARQTRPDFIGFHAPPEVLDGRDVRWAREYSKITFVAPRGRPLGVRLTLHPPPGSPPDGVHVRFAIDEVPLDRRIVRGAWQEIAFDLQDPSAHSDRVTLQVFSETVGAEVRGVGVGDATLIPLLSIAYVLRAAGLALAAGLLVWSATPSGRQVWTIVIARLRQADINHRFRMIQEVFPYLLGLVPSFCFRNGVVLAWLWLACLALMALGRVTWLACRRWAGDGGLAVYRDAVFHFFVGLSLGACALYTVSFVWKRILLQRAAIHRGWLVTLAAAGVIALASSVRRHANHDPIQPARGDVFRLATFFLVVGLLGGPHATALYGYAVDPLQHIAWANQLWLQGFVPDRYAGTTLPIDYPLAFHSYAWVLAALTPLPAAAAVNALPSLASALFIYLVLKTTSSLHGVANSPAGEMPRRATLGAVEFVAFLALAIALSSAQFGIWNYLEGTARLAGGLVQLVPLLVLAHNVARLTRRQRPQDVPSPGRGIALRLCALITAGALSPLINPAHVPLQALLTFAAVLSEVVLVNAASWRMALAGASRGLVAGGLLAAIVLATDPYSWMLMRPASPAVEASQKAVERRRADFLSGLSGQSCLTTGCFREALARNSVVAAAAWPWRTLMVGPVDFLARRAHLSRGTLEPATRFPDLIGWGVDPPIHPPAAYGLAIVPYLFLLTLRRRSAAIAVLVSLGVVLCGADLWLRNMAVALIDLQDPQLRLLLPYSARASTVFFNQLVWTVLIGGILVGLADVRPRAIRVAAAVVALVIVAVLLTAWPDVRDRTVSILAGRSSPTLTDIRDLRELEAQFVPADESHLVSSRAAVINLERWIAVDDPSAELYVHSARPTVFFYFQSHSAALTSTDLESVCAQLREGGRRPAILQLAKARWVAVRTQGGASAEAEFKSRTFCGVPLARVFPTYVAVGASGHVGLFRLW